MAKVRKVRIAPPISPQDAQRLVHIAEKAAGEYRGTFDEIESAVGMLILGRLFGWKVLLLIHNKRTIKKYEEILAINAREEFPEIGPWADKSVAFQALQGITNFWKAVSGEVKIEGRRDIGDGK